MSSGSGSGSGSGSVSVGVGVGALHVVVPARDEELVLAACLSAVATSLERARVGRPGLATRVTVVLDRCTDASASIARAAGVELLELQVGAVGAARAAGVGLTAGWLSTLGSSVPAERVWVATTDADSRVPADWLREHLDLADRGSDLVVGPVRLDSDEVAAPVARAWEQAHPIGVDAVFGANLGFRLDRYDRVGGFASVREHEDVMLVAALRNDGVSHARSTLSVTTSARTMGRTPGGLAGYLRELVPLTRA